VQTCTALRDVRSARTTRTTQRIRDNLLRLVLVPCAVLTLALDVATAQRFQAEVRLDAIGPRPYSIQLGAGLIFPFGYYVRSSVDVGWGQRDGPTLGYGEWRGDLLTRFLLDPFRQQRWGLSLGGGLSVRRHTYLAAIVDLEGPERLGFLPAIQVGLGGGLRAGVVLRRAYTGRR
jgi:hypothetical protein